MPPKIDPRRVITVDDSGTVTRQPMPLRRTNTGGATRQNIATAGSLPSATLSARGNVVAMSEAVRAVQHPESDTPQTRAYYRMAASESETLSAVRAAGGNNDFLFAGQRGRSGDEDTRHTSNISGWGQYRSGERQYYPSDPVESQALNYLREEALQLETSYGVPFWPNGNSSDYFILGWDGRTLLSNYRQTVERGVSTVEIERTTQNYWNLLEYPLFGHESLSDLSNHLFPFYVSGDLLSQTSSELAVTSLVFSGLGIAAVVVAPPAAPGLFTLASWLGNLSSAVSLTAAFQYIHEGNPVEASEEAIAVGLSLINPIGLREMMPALPLLRSEFFGSEYPWLLTDDLELAAAEVAGERIGVALSNLEALIFGWAGDQQDSNP